MRAYVRLALPLALVVALAVLADEGTPAYAWTAPAALNTNAATDSGDEVVPDVTTDGGGNWVAVWFSTDRLGGTIGTDRDILYSTEYIPPYPPVGGIAELPEVTSDSRWSASTYAALAGGLAAALALTAGAWYARRRGGR